MYKIITNIIFNSSTYKNGKIYPILKIKDASENIKIYTKSAHPFLS